MSKPNKMTVEQIQEKAQELIDQLTQLVNETVPQKGNSESECQHVCVINAIGNLESTLSGISPEDLAPNEDWETTNKKAGFIF